MVRLGNKHILLMVTGGIAAYKSAELVRLLVGAGANVEVIMTKGATEFITPLTLQALSGNPVHQHLLDAEAEAGMGHIQLAKWADAIIIAPCTAQTLARLTQGFGDDLLGAVCLATKAPIFIAPAMNQAMWSNAATQANIRTLKQREFILLGPSSGEQACGDVGLGRMLEPQEVLTALQDSFQTQSMAGRKIVITAGPTREAIDPVRYLSNHSSGKMGYALAQAAIEAGAYVTLISGPTALAPPEGAKVIKVESASEMFVACQQACEGAEMFIASAAVADYRPVTTAEQKLKKSYQQSSSITLELAENPDILASIAKQFPKITCIGFAAETNNVLKNAKAKLMSKGAAMIIANDVSNQDIGFNSDQNQVHLITQDGTETLPKQSKSMLSRVLIDDIAKLL